MQASAGRRIVRVAVWATLGAAFVVGLRLLGWGPDLTGYLQAPPRTGSLVVVVMLCLVGGAWAPARPLSRGRRDRLVEESPRLGRLPVLPLGSLVLLAHEALAPWCDRHAVVLLPGEAWRWLGLAVLMVGGWLSTWSVVQLGPNFSGYVTIQEGHTLVTGGLYRWLRHPRYAGIIGYTLGLALVHRAALGAVLAAATAAALVARIGYEEALLESEFGDWWRAYAARTRARLLPGVW